MNHLETRHRSEVTMPVAQSKHNPWQNLHRATVSRARNHSFRRLSLIMTAHYRSTCWVNIDKGVVHAVEVYLHPAFPPGKLLYSEFSLLFFFIIILFCFSYSFLIYSFSRCSSATEPISLLTLKLFLIMDACTL